MERVILIFAVIALIIVGIVWLIDKFLKPKWLKYILVLFLVILTMYFLFEAKTGKYDGFRNLGYFVLAMFTFCGMMSSLIASIIFDVRRKIKYKNSKQHKI